MKTINKHATTILQFIIAWSIIIWNIRNYNPSESAAADYFSLDPLSFNAGACVIAMVSSIYLIWAMLMVSNQKVQHEHDILAADAYIDELTERNAQLRILIQRREREKQQRPVHNLQHLMQHLN